MIHLWIAGAYMCEGMSEGGGVDIEPNSFVISIMSPGGRHPKFQGPVAVLETQFYGIDRTRNINGVLIHPISREQAIAIVKEAMKNKDKSNWMIHCEAGISRSPGVALGLAKIIKYHVSVEELERRYPCYNRYVRRMIEEAIDELCDSEKIRSTKTEDVTRESEFNR